MAQREHEHTLNVWFADELRKRGLNAKAEVIHAGNRRIDVEARIGPVVVAVEAEHGQSAAKKSEAIRDADNRLTQNLAQCAVAVCYPDDTTRESLSDARLIWTVRSGVDDIADWVDGGIDQLASVIRLAPAQLGDPDAAAASLSAVLDEAVNKLSAEQKQLMARALDLPPSKPGRANRSNGGRWDKAAKRALLVIATAVMFHSRLDSHLHALRPEYDNRIQGGDTPFTGKWPPQMARVCSRAADPVAAFLDAWDLILALDYKPIFETATAALLSCPTDIAFSHALRETANAALEVAQNIASMRHDLLGRIFHTVLDTARYDGSFYTTTAAATLLATLAITEDICDWNDPDAIADLRITDPACGTGTLLMAAAERIHDLAPQARDDGDVARALIEQVFSGYDVNLTATHMAATTLGLLSPTTRFQNMKIGRAFLGVDEQGDAYLGSLEFLDQQPKMMAWPNAAQPVSQIDSGDRMSSADPADLVIMNPPFTRDSLRHDQFSKEHEKKIKAREKTLFANKPVHLSSNGNAFLILADFIRKMDRGAIAAILPLVTATNASAHEIRQFLGRNYHVETIVTSHDPQRIYFSENTSIGEMLLICRKWDDANGGKPPTTVINLAVNPDTPAMAYTVAYAIQNDTAQSSEYGTVQHVPAREIAEGNWGAVQFLSEHLVKNFTLP
ncbi:MAG: SAM-dependent DNA methyltransferase [Chloroflexi bacterium]|nr:SAM-dependent DNA methyltransferase [Chloroflexota bacterium]